MLYIAHRGGPNLHPEHTMAAYRAIVEQGAVAIEQDCCLLADGSLGVMHDGTLDRTTSTSANTVDQTAASWQTLSVDIGASLGGAYTSYTERPPMFEEVVREFGNKVILVPEAKTTGAGAAIVAVLQKYGVRTDAAIVQSFTLSELSAAVTAGYRTCFLGTGQTPATVAAAGVDSICVASTESEATFTAITAAGLEAGAYTISRHNERDTLIGYGCTFFFSDDPIYLSGTGYKRTTDPFASNTWYHGHLALGSVASRGGFAQTVAGSWGINSTAAQYGGALQGWASPITHASFELTFTAKFVASSATGRWISVFLGTNDKEFKDTSQTGLHGYHFLGRNNSYVNAYRTTDGVAAATLSTSTTVTAISDGSTATYKLTVTPTTLKFERTDVATSTGALSETTYRPADGWYLSLGRNGVNVEFYDVTITAL